MNYRRDYRASRASLLDGFDGLEEGGIRASSSYSREINEHDNDKAIESLQDRVGFLKRLTGDIHEDVESHNRLLDGVGSGMDGSRGLMLGTMDRFKKDPQIFYAWMKSNQEKLINLIVMSCPELNSGPVQ